MKTTPEDRDYACFAERQENHENSLIKSGKKQKPNSFFQKQIQSSAIPKYKFGQGTQS